MLSLWMKYHWDCVHIGKNMKRISIELEILWQLIEILTGSSNLRHSNLLIIKLWNNSHSIL